MAIKSAIKTLCLSSTAFLATSAVAQANDWTAEATIYLFTPETDISLQTPQGTLEGSLSFSDALSNLDVAFFGAFSVSNGQWSILGDYNFTDLSFSNSTPGPAFSGLETSDRTQFFSGYLAYQVYESDKVKIDAAGGFRWFRTETDLTLTAGTAPSVSFSADDNWIDPLIAARLRYTLSDKWAATGFVDYGGFRSGSETWQILATADYAINEKWVLRGGYRYIAFEHEINGNDFEFDQSGPVFGATYRF